MLTVPDDIAAVLRGSHTSVARLVALSALGSVVATWEGAGAILEEASVSFDRTAHVRRTGSATLANADGALSPRSVGDLFHSGSRFRIERGPLIDGNAFYLPLATLVVVHWSSSLSGRLRITGADPYSLCAQPFGEVMAIEAGTPAADALRAILGPVLDPDGLGAAWVLDDGGRTCPLRVFLEDEERLAGAVELMADLGLVTYADRLGEPVLRPVPDPTTPATVTVVREFTPGATSVLLDLERSGDRRPYNRVIVDVVAPDREQIRAIVEVTDPGSPLHRDRIGVQTAPIYRTSQTLGQAAANAVGRALLTEYALSDDRIRSRIVPDLLLDEDDVVSFDEAVSGTDDRYRLDRMDIPGLTGDMPIEASKVLPVFAS